MRSSNFLIAVMLVIAGWILAVGGHTYWYAGGLTLVIGLHLLGNFRLASRPTILTELLLFLPFAAWYHYLPRSALSGFAPVDVLFILGFYLLALGTHHLLCSANGGSRHQAFAAAITAVTLAGTATEPIPSFLPLLLIFIAATLLELRQSQGLLSFHLTRSHIIPYAIVLVLLGSLFSAVQYIDVVQLPQLNRWMNQKMLDGGFHTATGMSRVTHLGDIRDAWEQGHDDQITLRQWSDTPAAYLRAAVYDRYELGTWRILPELLEERSQTDDHGRTYFNLVANGADTAPIDTPATMIYPSSDLTDDYFLPLGTQRIATFGDRLLVSNVLTVRSPTRQAAGGYAYYPPVSDTSPPGPADLEVPKTIRPALAKLAHRLTAESTDLGSTSQPAATLASTRPAVVPHFAAMRIDSYFRKNFTYHLGIRLSRKKDPVMEFLEDIKAGHCEYFASAGTLLLRSLGIPARYVTGFLCDEPGPAKGYSVARRKDAHAWVEYFVKGLGWVTFDPTPPEDRPPAVHPDAWQRLSERFGAWWQRIWSVAVFGGVFALISILWSAMLDLLAWVPRPVWLVIIVAGSAWVFRAASGHFGGHEPKARSRLASAPCAKLRRAEKMLGRHGLTRPAGMTVGAYLHAAQGAAAPTAKKERAVTLLREYQKERFRREYIGR